MQLSEMNFFQRLRSKESSLKYFLMSFLKVAPFEMVTISRMFTVVLFLDIHDKTYLNVSYKTTINKSNAKLLFRKG